MSLSSRAFWRPGGWENLCRLMCHCVRHIGLDNKHGQSVEATHSFLSRWRAGTELCASTQNGRGTGSARVFSLFSLLCVRVQSSLAVSRSIHTYILPMLCEAVVKFFFAAASHN